MYRDPNVPLNGLSLAGGPRLSHADVPGEPLPPDGDGPLEALADWANDGFPGIKTACASLIATGASVYLGFQGHLGLSLLAAAIGLGLTGIRHAIANAMPSASRRG